MGKKNKNWLDNTDEIITMSWMRKKEDSLK